MGKTGKNLRWKNENKLRELTSDTFRQVKICCFRAVHPSECAAIT